MAQLLAAFTSTALPDSLQASEAAIVFKALLIVPMQMTVQYNKLTKDAKSARVRVARLSASIGDRHPVMQEAVSKEQKAILAVQDFYKAVKVRPVCQYCCPIQQLQGV